jgi:hypothetical protein
VQQMPAVDLGITGTDGPAAGAGQDGRERTRRFRASAPAFGAAEIFGTMEIREHVVHHIVSRDGADEQRPAAGRHVEVCCAA